MASAGASLYNFGICKIGVHFLPDGDIIRENAGRRKTDLERDIRKAKQRLLGILGALWLVIGCLGGCKAAPPQDVPVRTEIGQPDGTVQITETAQAAQTETPQAAEVLQSGTKAGSDSEDEKEETAEAEETLETEAAVEESGSYTGRDEVALYLHLYGHLPQNYITKKEAEALGWNSREGNLWEVAPGMSIGGSRFGNYEGALPEKKGRKYYECDIDFEGGYRGAKRIIYSDDGLIFYTEDHYKTFVQLYGQ